MQTNLQHDSSERLWRQVLARDPEASFVYAVSTTGIFCRPTCPSRRPALENVAFFANAAAAVAAGYRACKRCAPLGMQREAAMVARLCRFLDRHRDRTPSLAELGRLVQSSPFTVQRTFVRLMGVSPRAYHAGLRASQLRRALGGDGSITQAIYQAGYSSSSRFYEHASENLGMSPTRFRKRGQGETICFSVAPCALGLLLVAATERGLCAVALGSDRVTLEQGLRDQFREAKVLYQPLNEYVSGILAKITDQPDHPAVRDLPLDIRATSFQARVWQALQQIPRGETRSYAQLARSLGQPTAVRAVARACAVNPVAIAIPCHRVIGSDGSLTGYRWGVERKKKLLEMEAKSGL